jgi:outer membrane scaffolding protein for murein synthesis (MipA/OmpV family)
MRFAFLLGAALLAWLGMEGAASAGSPLDWFEGEWSLTLGGAGYVAPDYEGSDSTHLSGMPLLSIGRKGSVTRFSSLNDSASFAVVDTGVVRFGPVGALVLPRDEGTSSDLRGLADVPWGLEVGGFLDVYPTDWARLRTEVRAGVHAYSGGVADIALDGFTDLTPALRLSGGPRLSLASQGYFDAYYGVTPAESVASGLATYDPGGGLRSTGVGGALTWTATDKVTTSLFAEYKRLLGPAADSSLVQERGSVDQFVTGVSATYRFDFAM